MPQNEHIANISLFFGGARSGKSQLAENLTLRSGLEPIYLATSEIGDAEMADRVDSHRARRGAEWRLLEVPLELADSLKEVKASEIVLIDCLTLWLSNLMHADRNIGAEQANLVNAMRSCSGKIVCVSNEVGMGIVPDNQLGRKFRDAQGLLNKKVAEIADTVVFVAAGLPLVMKGSLPEHSDER